MCSHLRLGLLAGAAALMLAISASPAVAQVTSATSNQDDPVAESDREPEPGTAEDSSIQCRLNNPTAPVRTADSHVQTSVVIPTCVPGSNWRSLAVERHRWYGWEELAIQGPLTNVNSLTVRHPCGGTGTYTYQGAVAAQGWYERVGPNSRFSC